MHSTIENLVGIGKYGNEDTDKCPHGYNLYCAKCAKEKSDEIQALMQDAKRYRWLRKNKHLDIWWSVEGPENREDNIDADIDAAMLEHEQGKPTIPYETFEYVSPVRYHKLLEVHCKGKEFSHKGRLFVCVACDPVNLVFQAYRKLDKNRQILTFKPMQSKCK